MNILIRELIERINNASKIAWGYGGSFKDKLIIILDPKVINADKQLECNSPILFTNKEELINELKHINLNKFFLDISL